MLLPQAKSLARRKVVFDIDDTTRPLGKTAAEISQIPFQKMREFQVLHNEALAMDERVRLNDALHDVKTYEQLEFYYGFEKLMELEKLGAELYFSSNAFSQEVNDLKAQQVLRALPDFPPERLQFYVVSDAGTVQKKIDEGTYILVDDSPYTIARSPARYNIVPTMPWNQTTKAYELMRDKVYTLVPAENMMAIYSVIRFLLRNSQN